MNAAALGRRLKGMSFAQVFTSPLQRARNTCRLAGFGAAAVEDRELVEWNYGAYEGMTTAEVRRQRPDWEIFRDGCPGGESVADLTARVDGVVARLRNLDGNLLLFSHGHFLRFFVARWLELDAASGRHFLLDAAALSIVGYESERRYPVVRLWNDCRAGPLVQPQ
jgi:probable phosphoglycerate mutase